MLKTCLHHPARCLICGMTVLLLASCVLLVKPIIRHRQHPVEAKPLLEVAIPADIMLPVEDLREMARRDPGENRAEYFLQLCDSIPDARTTFEYLCRHGWKSELRNMSVNYSLRRFAHGGERDNRYCASSAMEMRRDHHNAFVPTGYHNSYTIFQKGSVVIAIYEETTSKDETGELTNEAILYLANKLPGLSQARMDTLGTKDRLALEIVFLGIRDRDLKGIDLSNTDLSRASFDDAILIGANLSSANLSQSDFFRANLSMANLNKAKLKDAVLISTNLSGADLGESSLDNANLLGANLSGAVLTRATLIGADAYEANLSGANLIQADLSGASLMRADLSMADLSNANLQGADFSSSKMQKANLSHADLRGADLVNVDLQGAILRNANLQGAKLWSPDLEVEEYKYANLKDADLTNADLTDAEVTAEQLAEAASLKGAIMPDGTRHE